MEHDLLGCKGLDAVGVGSGHARKVTTHASLSDFRGIYAGAVIALLIIGFGVYIVAGFNLSSVIFFLFSLEQMAGRFVI